MLRIVADENIPLVAAAFGRFGEVRAVPATALTPALVRDADVLLVRSVTRVDAALVAGSRLSFVGSATIGADHVALPALRQAGIVFRHAPGSNAESVVEWVLAALLTLAVRTGQPLRGRTVGIIGCGNIGARLAARLPAFGARVLCNDPPLADAAERAGRTHGYVSLELVLAESDVVTLHVPLTTAGPWPTRHLIAESALAQLRPEAWLLNSSRGAVVSNAALARALAAGRPGAVLLDVWEGEPEPDPALHALADLATPHIAGYSWDGKVNGTLMLHDALVQELGLEPAWDARTALAAAPGDGLRLEPPPPLPETQWLHALTRQLYDIEQDDARMRTLLALPPAARAAAFRELRRTYPRRRAFPRHGLADALLPAEFRT
ncbi:MAG: 4-phosphoerythronate dehydrogenase, partial [Gemmatimonadetes bacterium]|nr:4-phosphoerythronate dehydrogenase [Gemmatimonadota bacterium]